MKLDLFTKNNCVQCKMTKKFLKQHNVEFEEHNISENPEYIDYLKNKGFQAVPIVNGFRPDLLKKLIAQ